MAEIPCAECGEVKPLTAKHFWCVGGRIGDVCRVCHAKAKQQLREKREQDKERKAAESLDRIVLMERLARTERASLPKSNTYTDTQEKKSWSHRYQGCVKCGTTEIKHRAKGLCINCYRIENEKRQRDYFRKRGTASTKLSKEYLLEEYTNNKKSLGEIARECCCSRQYIHNKIKLYQIPLRDKSSSRQIALKKNKICYEMVKNDGFTYPITHQRTEVNDEFFSSWSMQMAYVLGLIYTDGNLFHDKSRKQFRMSLSQKDPELLNKMEALMDCNAKLQFSAKRVYKNTVAGEMYRLEISNYKIYTDLIELGLSPQKSLTLDFPDIPQQYVRHFIRGCWDGDGSVYLDKTRRAIRASFISGSLSFIRGMLHQLNKAGLKKRQIYTVRGSNTSYYFRFFGSQCKTLYHFLYDDVPRQQYLERKHDVFAQYFYNTR